MRSKICLLLACLAGLGACAGADEELIPSEPKAVKLFKVEQAESRLSNSYPATIRSVRSTDLAFQVGGRITEWRAFESSQFRRGDVIARLDARNFQNAVIQAEAQFNNAQSEYERAQRLIEEDAISQSVLESRLAQLSVASAQLDSARKDLADTALVAPFSGVVGRTYVEQFQSIQPQAPIVSLQSQEVEAIIDVPGSFVVDVPKFRNIETFVELDAAPGQQLAATFREASGQADSSTQTFEVKFTFTPPRDLLVLNGMTAQVRTSAELFDETDSPQSGLVVPLAAILESEGKKYVWVVKPLERTIARREIETSSSVGEMILVSKGLKAGETVVAAGGAYLNEGDRVRAWTPE